MSSNAATREVAEDFSPFLKIYTDGTYERLIESPYFPPVLKDPTSGVSSKDVTDVTPPVRIFLPEITDPNQKLPILIQFHSGGFMVGSIFSAVDFKYLNAMSSATKTLIVAVEYPLVPEQLLPAAYEDSEAAVKWVCSHALEKTQTKKDPWISTHGDFSKIFLQGDSSGANVSYNLAMRFSSIPLPGNLKISGILVTHPGFCGSIPIGGDFEGDIHDNPIYRMWAYSFPNCPGGIDSPFFNPFAVDDASLSAMGCSKLLVAVAENDIGKARGLAFAEKMKKCGYPGSVEIVVSYGEGHCFHVFDPHGENAKILFGKFSEFINSEKTREDKGSWRRILLGMIHQCKILITSYSCCCNKSVKRRIHDGGLCTM